MAFRVYFGIASLIVLGLCAVNYWIELTPQWKGYQRKYYNRLAAKIDDPDKAAEAAAAAAKFVQIYNQQLGVADRCTICHLGMENPLMDGAENPFKVHPGNLLVKHPPEAVGCTMCHQGQGLATTADDAHGKVRHWDKPLLTGHFVQASCTKCHHEDEVPQAPVLSRGKHLLHELGCVGCHRTGDGLDDEKVGPRLAVIGSKVSRPWLNKWLINPKTYLPKGQMPQFNLRSQAANALAAYLATFRDKSIDASAEPKGDHDAGKEILGRLQCITCHVTREDARGNPVGGTIGPDLRKVGNKVNKRWLTAFFKDPHAFYPHTKMPRFYLTDQEAADLAAYAAEEWVDFDLQDAEKKEPKRPADSPALVEQGKDLFVELNCSGCHDLSGQKSKPTGPDLTFEGSKAVHDLDFGDAPVRHTIPDFLYSKLKSPKSLGSHFRLPLGEDYAAAIWKNLQPVALFSKAVKLPEGSPEQRLAWVLDRAKEQGVLDRDKVLPKDSPREQAAWMAGLLSEAGALTPLKMPDFQLNDPDAEALTIALMSQSAERVSLANYEVPRKSKPIFDPKDDFGGLEHRYRCLSCHSIRGSGDPQACDITLEGSKVNRQWLYGFLRNPYSMRRTLTIAMPSFNFPDDQARFMSEYISAVFVDRQIGEGWKQGQDKADAARGKDLFFDDPKKGGKGCIACHQVNGKGGDVGPSFTTQVPDFPQGTWVGDKLRPEWVYQWVKDPQSLVPDTIDPNLGLSDQDSLDLTKYVMSLKNPAVPKKAPDVPKK